MAVTHILSSSGKSVGIVGLGGLGHFAVQFAKAMNCKEIVVFSHSPQKQAFVFSSSRL
jgi:alcohol dehydrogenase (NADP+)